MRRNLAVITVAIALAAMVGSPDTATAQFNPPDPGAVGSEAVDWTLGALGGGTYTLSDYRGEKVVFFFVVGWG